MVRSRDGDGDPIILWGMNQSTTSWGRDELTRRVAVLETELEDTSDRQSSSRWQQAGGGLSRERGKDGSKETHALWASRKTWLMGQSNQSGQEKKT